MTESEAMVSLIGRLAMVTEPTFTGERTIIGSVTTPMLITEEGITHLTVEGMVATERITGLPLPIEPETPIRLELLPVESVMLL